MTFRTLTLGSFAFLAAVRQSLLLLGRQYKIPLKCRIHLSKLGRGVESIRQVLNQLHQYIVIVLCMANGAISRWMPIL